MSKYFNDTRKAQEWAAQEGAADLNAEQLLKTIREANAASAEVAGARLNHCRKLRLYQPPGMPIILSQRDAALQAAAESYRALRTRLLRLQSKEGVRSVVITSALGGEGKTLTAMNLALALCQLPEMRVLLIDGDLRTRRLTSLFGCPPPGLAEVLAGKTSFEETFLATDLPNLYIMGAGTPSASPPELYAGPRWKESIGWASECFKLILIDSTPILPLSDFELISAACYGYLTVVRALTTQREALQKAARVGDPKKSLGVVLNSIETGAYANYYGPY